MRRLAGPWLAFLLAACAPVAPLPSSPLPAGPAIRIDARPVERAPAGSGADAGRFVYAGGLELTCSDTSRLHGLSDLEVQADGRMVAVSDEGDLLTARLVLDAAGRLTGVADGQLQPLKNPEGASVEGKEWGDAEGVAVTPNGGLLVSFERHHRIWLYRDGKPAQPVPAPDFAFPDNGGMEALSIDRAAGDGNYITAAEDTGETWTCKLSGGCVQGPTLQKPKEFGVVAVRRLPQGRTAWMFRAFDVVRGPRIEVRIVGADGRTLDSLNIARPATVDNFEGLGAVPRADGSVRFYLLSDDNFTPPPLQRTLLLAFDWTPAKGN